MAKITRKNMKVFGSSAGPNQIGKFGSLAAADPQYTTDPETIQELSNYLTGWFGAVIGANSPAIEDLNAISYLFAYQLSYLMQTGVPEWDTNTTYFIGSVVNDGYGRQYISLIDDNIGNPVSDFTKWKPSNTGVLPLGSIIALSPQLTGAYDTSATTEADANGFVVCGGQTIDDASSPMNGAVIPNINDSVFLMGSSTGGTAGGANSITLTEGQLPAHVHTIDHGHTNSFALGNATVASSAHRHNMAHTHIFWRAGVSAHGWARVSSDPSSTSIPMSDVSGVQREVVDNVSAGEDGPKHNVWAANLSNWTGYTTGVFEGPSGTGSSANTGTALGTATVTLSGSVTSHSGNSGSKGSGEAIDNRPKYITVKYAMRVK